MSLYGRHRPEHFAQPPHDFLGLLCDYTRADSPGGEVQVFTHAQAETINEHMWLVWWANNVGRSDIIDNDLDGVMEWFVHLDCDEALQYAPSNIYDVWGVVTLHPSATRIGNGEEEY